MQARGFFSVFAVMSATMLVSAQQIPPLQMAERTVAPPTPIVWSPHDGEPAEHIDRIMKEIRGNPLLTWGQHIIGRVERYSATAPGDGWVTESQSQHDLMAGVTVSGIGGYTDTLTTVDMRFGDIRVHGRSSDSEAVVRAWHVDETARVVTRRGTDLETVMASLLPEYIGVWVGAVFQRGLNRVPILGRVGPEIRWTSVERGHSDGVDENDLPAWRFRITGESAWGTVTLEYKQREEYTATFELSESPRRRYILQTLPLQTQLRPWRDRSPDQDAVEVVSLADLRPAPVRLAPGEVWPLEIPVHWSAVGGWGIDPVCARRDAPGVPTDAAVVILTRVPVEVLDIGDASLPTAVDLVLAQLDQARQQLVRDSAEFGVPVDPRTQQPVWRLAVAPVFVFQAPDARAATLVRGLERQTSSRQSWHPDLVAPAWAFSPETTIDRFVRPNMDAVAVFVRRSGVISRVLPVDALLDADVVAKAIADTVWPWRETPDANGP